MNLESNNEFEAYFTYENKTDSVIPVSVGAPIEDFDGIKLYDLPESKITKEICCNPNLLKKLLPKFGINYPNCWYCREIPTEKLDPLYIDGKPGDIDLIFGNFEDDNRTISYDNILAVQIKIWRIKEDNELKKFSEYGTKQAYGTAMLGFDRTLLLHVLVREPKPILAGNSPLWSVLDNADFFHHAKRIIGSIKGRLEKELYGYGWLGWGQSANRNLQLSGTLKLEIYTESPFQPWKHQIEIELKRKKLIENLMKLSKQKSIKTLPHCLFKK